MKFGDIILTEPNNLLNSLFVDPVNTGANVVSTGIAFELLSLSKQQLSISKESLQISKNIYHMFLENNELTHKRDAERDKILSEILEQLKKLNEPKNIREVK